LQNLAGVAGNTLEWCDFAVFGCFSDVFGLSDVLMVLEISSIFLMVIVLLFGWDVCQLFSHGLAALAAL
jgi:hypothetical protein